MTGLVIALDRQEKGNDCDVSAVQQIVKDYGFPVVSIVNLEALINYLNRGGELSSHLEAIKKYREMYGALLVCYKHRDAGKAWEWRE